MKTKVIAVMIALSIIVATILTVRPTEKHSHICLRTYSIVQVMTSSTMTSTVRNHTPNNHNIQEMVVSLVKKHDFANSADYMEGLTAISKRSIYVGEAASDQIAVKMNL